MLKDDVISMKKNYLIIAIIVIAFGSLFCFVIAKNPSLQPLIEVGSFTIAVCAIISGFYLNEEDQSQRRNLDEQNQSQRRKEAQEQKKENVVMKLMRALGTNDNSKKSVADICVTLCELLQTDCSSVLKEQIKTQIKDFSQKQEIDDEKIAEIYTLLEKEFQSVTNQTVEGLKILLSNKEGLFFPQFSDNVVDYLMSKDLDLVTSRRIEIILDACLKNIGKEVSKDKIKEEWSKEADIDKNDEFRDGHATNPTKVENTLKGLDGRKKGQKELKKILVFDSSYENFKIEEKNRVFVEEVLSKLQMKQSDKGLRVRGKGVA